MYYFDGIVKSYGQSLCVEIPIEEFEKKPHVSAKMKIVFASRRYSSFLLIAKAGISYLALPQKMINQHNLAEKDNINFYYYFGLESSLKIPDELGKLISDRCINMENIPKWELKQFIVMFLESKTTEIKEKRLEFISKALSSYV